MAREIKQVWFGPGDMQTSLGDGTHETLAGIEAARCGLRDDPAYGMVAGGIARETKAAAAVKGYTVLESLFIRVIGTVAREAGLNLSDGATRLVLSTTKGNIDRLAGCTTPPPEAFLPELGRRVAGYFGAPEPIVVSNACISGVSALIVARRMLSDGCCTHAIVAGGDLLTEFVAEGFRSFKSISDGPCRPYDARRSGLTLGEACGAVLVTTDRRLAAEPAVALEGGAITNDANHISGPSRTGDGLFFAIDRAMRQADVGPDEVGFVNAHGTATLYNDEMESKALQWAGLDTVPLNSLKGYIGHTLGASGVVETIVCAEELRRGTVYGVQGFETGGVPVPLNLSAQHRPLRQGRCVKTASGFGGCNAAVVLALESCTGRPHEEPAGAEAVQTATYTLPAAQQPFAEFIRAEFKALEAPNMKFYKMDNLCKAAYVAAERLLSATKLQERYDPREIAVVLANRSASLDTDLAHQRIVDARSPEGASPAVFVYTLPNVAAGELCIRHRIQGENTFFVESSDSGLSERYARRLIERGEAKAAVCGWCELLGENWNVTLKLLETK